jgi:hypothetical protein
MELGAGLLLVLLTVVHISTPFLVHLFVRHIKLRRLQQATRQAVDECHVTSACYSRMVTEFRARHCYALLASNSVTSQMLAELTDIRQRLIHRVCSIRRRLRRERVRNTVKRFSCIARCCSVTSMYYYCALWMWVMYMLMMPNFDVTVYLVPACVWLAYVAAFAWLQYRWLSSSSTAKLLKNAMFTLTNQLSATEMQPTTAYRDYKELFEHVEDDLFLDSDSVVRQQLLDNDDRAVGSHNNNNQNYSIKQSTPIWVELGLATPCEWCVNVFCLPWYCQLLFRMSQRVNSKHRVVYKCATQVNVHQPIKASTSGGTTSQSINCYQQQDKQSNNQQVTALLSNGDTKSYCICAHSNTASISHDEGMSCKTIIDDTRPTVQADHVTDRTIPLSTSTPTSYQNELSTVEASILTLTQRLKRCSELALTSDIELLSLDNDSSSFDVDYVSVQLI